MGRAVAVTLEKLPAIRGNLTRTDPNWEEWNFAQLMETQRLWTRSKPVGKTEKSAPTNLSSARPQSRAFQSHDVEPGILLCLLWQWRTPGQKLHCHVPHRTQEDPEAKEKLHYRATRSNKELMRARARCPVDLCHKWHHTSICQTPEEPGLKSDVWSTTVPGTWFPEVSRSRRETSGTEGTNPVVLVWINCLKFRAL